MNSGQLRQAAMFAGVLLIGSSLSWAARKDGPECAANASGGEQPSEAATRDVGKMLENNGYFFVPETEAPKGRRLSNEPRARLTPPPSPALFVPNEGQWKDKDVCFSTTNPNYAISLRPCGADLSLSRPKAGSGASKRLNSFPLEYETAAIQWRFVGARKVKPEGVAPFKARTL